MGKVDANAFACQAEQFGKLRTVIPSNRFEHLLRLVSKMREYLAHSFLNGWRFSNPGLDAYLKGTDGTDAYFVDPEGHMEEAILLGTRMARGIALSAFQAAYGEGRCAKLIAAAKRMAGLIELKDGRLSLTDEGFLVHSAIAAELVCGIEEM